MIISDILTPHQLLGIAENPTWYCRQVYVIRQYNLTRCFSIRGLLCSTLCNPQRRFHQAMTSIFNSNPPLPTSPKRCIAFPWRRGLLLILQGHMWPSHYPFRFSTCFLFGFPPSWWRVTFLRHVQFKPFPEVIPFLYHWVGHLHHYLCP